MNRSMWLSFCIGLALAVPGMGEQLAEGTGGVLRDAAPVTEDGALERARRFADLHRADAPGMTAPMPLATALNALATTAEGFDYSGRGDVDYWLRTAEDFAASGRALGRAFERVSFHMDQGPVAAAVGAIGAQLSTLKAGTRGDVYYWMNRTKEIAQRVEGAAQQIRAIAGGLTQETIAVSTTLEALAEVIASTDYSGRGDADYWLRATRNFCFIGRACGRGVQQVVGSLQEPIATVISTFANQLLALSEAGRGDVNYWLARAQATAEQMEGVSVALIQIARRL